jgi:hypothetical protein
MSIGPISRAESTRRLAERRRQERRAEERRTEGDAPAAPPPVRDRDHEPKSPPPSPGAVAAQLMGQEGAKRGLRGGKPVLESAKSAYLGTEYSGRNDRRPRKGRLTKTDV